MKVGIFNTKETPRARYIMDCLAEGMRANGDECVWIENRKHLGTLQHVDVTAQMCMVNQHRSGDPINLFRVEAWQEARRLGLRTLVLDTGFVSNQYDYIAKQKRNPVVPRFDLGDVKTFSVAERTVYYEIAYDGIKGFGDHCTAGALPLDRWKLLNRSVKPWRLRGSKILFMTQPLHGQSSQGTDVFAWYGKKFREIRAFTQMPVVVRIHPRVDKFQTSKRHTDKYRARIKEVINHKDVRWSEKICLEEDLLVARFAVAYSTSAAVAAVLEGVPVCVGSPGCMAWPMAQPDLKTASTRLCTIQRSPWLAALAYSQWNCAELRNGSAWSHYRSHATSPRKESVHVV